MILRIMPYNAHGATGHPSDLIQIVNDQKPSILGLLETVGWVRHHENQLLPFSQKVLLPQHFFAKANTEYDMALLGTAAPRKISGISNGMHHTFIYAVYSFDTIPEIALFLIHLSPKNEDARLRELKKIISLCKPFRYAIIFGDFNALSPHDPYNHDELISLCQQRGLKKFGTTSLRFDCIKLLERSGFLDAARVLRKPFVPTVPTAVNSDRAHITALRLDYVFITSPLASCIKRAEVIHSKLTDRASDHYPLVVDFRLN